MTNRVNKYKYVNVVQGNYGYGWDDLTEHDSYAPAKKDLVCYRQNEKGMCHRIIKRRILNEDYKHA